MPIQNSSKCIFIGGPLHDQEIQISDSADGVYIAENGMALAAIGSVGSIPPDYRRNDESNVFVHNSCTSDDIDAFFGEDELDDEPDNDEALINYVTGARDFCDALLQKFALANSKPAFLFN